MGRPQKPQGPAKLLAGTLGYKNPNPAAELQSSLSTPTRGRCCLAAADEVHNFEAVAGGYRCGFPLRMRNDLQIPLHGEPIRGEAQMGDELLHVQPLGDFTRLAIDLHCQGLAHEVFLTDDGQGFFPSGLFGFQLITQLSGGFGGARADYQCRQSGLRESRKRKLQ
jgi:hypothetical protein